MPGGIAKSYEISDAKIVFVSLVDKAANKREFLITKAEGSKAEFRMYGRILKADADRHFVTGVVYEPMVEDTDGNFMTEEEITKAAHWFMKNAGGVDIQHCFEKAEGVEVVESYVAKCDMEIEGQPVRKGTWLMTMEVTDEKVWDRIAKGEITGFSMGGKGSYSEVDVDISDPDSPVAKAGGRRGILKALASMLGMEVVEKGAVEDTYKRRVVNDNFWTAFYALSDCLLGAYDSVSGQFGPIHDEGRIREALEDFNGIVMELLAEEGEVVRSIEKAGKKMSAGNRETLKGIHESLGAFLAKFGEEEEDVKLSKSEVERMVQEAVAEMMKDKAEKKEKDESDKEEEVTKGANQKAALGSCSGASEGVTAEDIQKMVQEAVQKAVQPKEEPMAREAVQAYVDAAVTKAMEPVLRSAGLPTNLNDEKLEKDAGEGHYLHGFI